MDAQPKPKRRAKPVRLSGDKQTLVVQTRCGERIKLHYRTYRKGGKVHRVINGPFVVDVGG